MLDNSHSSPQNIEPIYKKVSIILTEARNSVWHAINTTMLTAYWEVGKTIVEVEQRGNDRSQYGDSLITSLAGRWSKEFGKGFDRSNLYHMRKFYLAYPKVDAVRRELSWTRYRRLLQVEKPDTRAFYEQEAINARWSTRELDR